MPGDLPSRTSRRALLYHNGIPVAVCPAGEPTREGLSVFCGPVLYERDTYLEVELDLGGETRRPLRLPARVANCSRSEMTLQFRELPAEAEARLRELSRGEPGPHYRGPGPPSPDPGR